MDANGRIEELLARVAELEQARAQVNGLLERVAELESEQARADHGAAVVSHAAQPTPAPAVADEGAGGARPVAATTEDGRRG